MHNFYKTVDKSKTEPILNKYMQKKPLDYLGILVILSVAMLAESYILLSAQNATLAYQDIEVGNLSVRHHSRPPRQPQPQIKGIEWQARECTAYNSVPEQTDDSPCIASDGSDICRRRQKGECIIATNEFENGTLVLIEGIGQCTVADKTNRRYQHRIDVFMGDDVTGAKNFGSKILNIYKLN